MRFLGLLEVIFRTKRNRSSPFPWRAVHLRNAPCPVLSELLKMAGHGPAAFEGLCINSWHSISHATGWEVFGRQKTHLVALAGYSMPMHVKDRWLMLQKTLPQFQAHTCNSLFVFFQFLIYLCYIYIYTEREILCVCVSVTTHDACCYGFSGAVNGFPFTALGPTKPRDLRPQSPPHHPHSSV